MPATKRGKSAANQVLGVDGCRAGWLVATRILPTGEISVAIADTFRSILDGPARSAAAIIVDMPIGIPEVAGRSCEREARRLLGPRRSSVFSTPPRQALAFGQYEDANAFGKSRGAGISRQAWGLVPKIREIDAAISPAMQARIGEGHPELAFARLRGAPSTAAKKSAAGRAERRQALIDAGIGAIDDLVSGLRADFPRQKDFGIDDLYDACALTFTALNRVNGEALRLGDGERDAKGLQMAIWR
jgi:predicted RNase H-like nuclease